MSDQFAYMNPWLDEKIEYVIEYLYKLQKILLLGYSDESGFDKFLSNRFPYSSCPDKEYMKDLFSSCSFQSDRECILELLSNSFFDLTKIFSFVVGGQWEIEDRDLLENQGIQGFKKLYKKYGLKQQSNIQVSNKMLSDQFDSNMAYWLYERIVSVIEKLLEVQNFFVADKQNIKELLVSPYNDSKTNNEHILDLLSDSFSELTSILKLSLGKDLEVQSKKLLGIRGDKGLDKLYVKYGIKSETDIHRDIFLFIREAKELLKGERVPNRTFFYDILYPIVKEYPLLQHIDNNLELVRDGEMSWEVFVEKTAVDLNTLEKLYENE